MTKRKKKELEEAMKEAKAQSIYKDVMKPTIIELIKSLLKEQREEFIYDLRNIEHLILTLDSIKQHFKEDKIIYKSQIDQLITKYQKEG